MRGLRTDVDFMQLCVLDPAQGIYLSHERIDLAKVMAKPPQQDRNAGRDRACPRHRSDYCGDDGATRPIFTVGVVVGQLVHRYDRADGGFSGWYGYLYPHIKDLRLVKVCDGNLLYCCLFR